MCMGILYGVSEATLKKYRGWAREYKLFMAHELQKLDASRFGEEASLRNANLDEIGAALEQNMGGDWKMAEGDVQWFHGPETNPWCLRKYVTFLANEMVAQADRMATLKRPNKTLKKRRQCSTAMLMGRLKALNLLIKLDGAIFRKPVLNLLRDFAECRIWVRVQYLFFPLRTGIEKQIPSTTHHDWAAKILGDAGITYSPVVHATRAGGAQHSSADGMPSDQLARLGGWRFIDVMTKHYLTTIPREAVLLKAGFTGVDGDYFIGRATVPVSEKLEKQLRKHIFPWAALVKGQKQCHDYNGKMVSEDKAEKQDTAGLNILKELDREARMAVTQDLTMYYIHQPVEQGNNIAVVLDKLDLVSRTVGMLGVSEGIAVKKSVDLNLSELKKGSPAEVQLRVKWMLVRDRMIDASLPASEFPDAWPQYCAQMPRLA
ncbi:unnamed protein product [Closterium sp. NIES-64]|nr:unnamed protein product [Closterium sp. NIES-64]